MFFAQALGNIRCYLTGEKHLGTLAVLIFCQRFSPLGRKLEQNPKLACHECIAAFGYYLQWHQLTTSHLINTSSQAGWHTPGVPATPELENRKKKNDHQLAISLQTSIIKLANSCGEKAQFTKHQLLKCSFCTAP